MRSWRLSFSRCCMCLALLSAFLVVTSRTALAEDWETVAQSQYWTVTDVVNTSFGTSNLTINVNNTERSGIGTLKTFQGTLGSLSNLGGSTVAYVLIPVAGGNVTANKPFRLDTTGFAPIYYTHTGQNTGGASVAVSPRNFRYFVRDSSWHEVTPTNGRFTWTSAVNYVAVSYTGNTMTQLTGKYDVSRLSGFDIRLQVADGEPTFENAIQEQTDEIGQQTQQQTETLVDTTGSGDIVSGMANQGQTISQGMNFVQQTTQFASGVVDAFSNADADSGLQFPGLTIMGHQILAAQTVNFTGYLGSDVETLIKNAVTMVLFLAWISGLIGFYHKIFLGEQEVEVVDE